jgi:N-acyl homoserine lactone hydrolase
MTPDLAAFAQDRPERLHILDLGLFAVHHPPRTIGIPGFLVTTSAGRRILIDTGFPDAYALDGAAAALKDGLGAFGHVLRLGPENLVRGQLAVLGLGAADIDLLILSHSHIDHVGGIGHFTHCPILLGTAEYRAARPLYFGDRRPMVWPAGSYIPVESDLALCQGLTILPTPGHTAGHLSVCIDLPRTGTVILAADAINRASEPAEGYPDAADPVTAAQSGTRLMALARGSGAFLIYGHDPAQWMDLAKAPDFFD